MAKYSSPNGYTDIMALSVWSLPLWKIADTLEECSMMRYFAKAQTEGFSYLWKIVWHGSGTDLVPNSVTTILLAAKFFLNVDDRRYLFRYVTAPFLMENLGKDDGSWFPKASDWPWDSPVKQRRTVEEVSEVSVAHRDLPRTVSEQAPVQPGGDGARDDARDRFRHFPHARPQPDGHIAVGIQVHVRRLGADFGRARPGVHRAILHALGQVSCFICSAHVRDNPITREGRSPRSIDVN